MYSPAPHLVRGAAWAALVGVALLATPGSAFAIVHGRTARLTAIRADGLTFAASGDAALEYGNLRRLRLGGSIFLRYDIPRAGTSTRADQPPELSERFAFVASGLFGTNGRYIDDGLREDLGDRPNNFNADLDEGVAVERAYVAGRWTHKWSQLLGTDLLVQYESDAFIDLRLRVLAGVLGRLDVLISEQVKANFRTGYLLELESVRLRLNEGPNGEAVLNDFHGSDLTNHRWASSASLSGAIVPDRLLVELAAYVQPRLDDFGDTRFLGIADVEVTINEHFSLGVQFSGALDTRPPGHVLQEDLRIQNSLRVVF